MRHDYEEGKEAAKVDTHLYGDDLKTLSELWCDVSLMEICFPDFCRGYKEKLKSMYGHKMTFHRQQYDIDADHTA